VPLLVAATTLVLQLDFEPINSSTVALAYLLPVLFSTLLAGWGGGLLASVLSFFAFNYFFLPPYHTLLVANVGDTLALLVFLAIAGLVSYLLGRARTEADRAQRGELEAHQRQQELAILYDLSKAISGQVGLERILQTIAERVVQLFANSRCEIWLRSESGALASVAQAGAAQAGLPPAIEVLIRSDQGALGILKLFAASPPAEMSAPDRQALLNAIAAQTASVVERSRLTQAATRARVLEDSDKLKTALLSSVSHDLRTPLATIKTAVTGLLRRDLRWDEESLVDQLQAINEETDRLNRIIGNLLSMSRIEAGAVQFQKRPYPLAEVIDAILARLAARLHAHSIRVDIPPELPLVPLDHAAFEQVISNLLDNAVKYSPHGSEIEIAARQVGHLVEISVSDQGRGIPAAVQQAVFGKFYRADPSGRVPGSGLGLAIVKGFVEAHGGNVWISDRSGKGTSVKFLLPLDENKEYAYE
jgi:two-component system sensor histidine kinase KdpD